MTILEFITEQYPIRERVQARLEDPYKKIENNDDLPFDKIGPDEFGNITKLVEIEDNRYISVMDIIGYTREEIEHSGDIPLLIAYDTYMSQINLEDINIVDIMECVKAHNDIVKRRESQLGVLSV